ncbi:MAG: SatD family protein [Clostridia bacterium]|nr:SatD family protein [Clostridia bacterium]
MYYAIIADIVSSKKIIDRNAVQIKLQGVLDYVNDKYANEITSKFCITIGDEFQGILSKCKYLFEIITFIEVSMYPLMLRFSVNYDEIQTEINPQLSIGSDGPAWWHARTNLEELKQTFGKGLKEQTNIIVTNKLIKNAMSQLTELINITLTLTCVIKYKWKQEHINIVKNIMKKFGLRSNIVQKKVADELNLQLKDLNKKLKTSRYFDYSMALEKITEVLEVFN